MDAKRLAWGPGMMLEEVDGAASFVWREGEVTRHILTVLYVTVLYPRLSYM